MQKNFELMGLFQVILVEVALSEENGHLERDGLFNPQVLDLGTETIAQFSVMKLPLFGKLLRTL